MRLALRLVGLAVFAVIAARVDWTWRFCRIFARPS